MERVSGIKREYAVIDRDFEPAEIQVHKDIAIAELDWGLAGFACFSALAKDLKLRAVAGEFGRGRPVGDVAADEAGRARAAKYLRERNLQCMCDAREDRKRRDAGTGLDR